jgi:glycosyltransferase involved in cell wall biosynthesis
MPSVTAFAKHCAKHFYDVVIFEYWRTGQQFAWVSRIVSPLSLIVVDCVDLEYIRLSRSSAYSDDHVKHTRQDETKLIQYCDAVICVSAVEANIVKTEMFVPEEYLTTFSVVYDRIKLDRKPTRGRLLFVGNGGHSPNLDAVTWFCREVMPHVNASVMLRLVGANWPNSLNAENVDVIGFVDDLGAEYANCSYVVSPIRFGSGVNGKVAEAYCYGVPMVISSLAADGCGISSGDGLTILSTENANDWVQAIDRLVACETYSDVDVSEKVADQFSYAANADRLSDFTNRLKSLKVNDRRRWHSTVLYAIKFVVSHIRHLTTQK